MTNSGNSLTIGEKIRNFRKRAGLSQFELETAIDASNGSISRIEQGKVNPTKETIKNIARELKINDRELSDLLEIRPLLPTQAEVAEAKSEVMKYFNRPNVLAYLIDEWWKLYAASKTIKQFFEMTDEEFELLTGKNVISIMLNPKYGIQDKLDPEFMMKTLAIETARIQLEMRENEKDMFENSIDLPDYNKIMEIVNTLTEEEVLSPENKVAYFISNGQKVKYKFSRETLKSNPRFEIIEFFDPEIYE